MIRKSISIKAKISMGILSVSLLIVAYSWMSYKQHVFNPKDTTIPNAQQFVEGWKKITTPEEFTGEIWLWNDLKATLGRHVGGMLLGVAIALFVGMAMGVNPWLESFFSWPVNFFAKIPPTAMMAVYFVLFGTEYKMFIAMIALGIFPTLAQTIYQSAKKDVDDDAINKAYTLGASHFEVIYNIIFMQILPRVIEAIRLQVGPALVFLIAAELLVSDVGFGYRLRIQSRLLNMNVVYLYLVILGMGFLLMDWGLRLKRRLLCPWFGE
jgi:NitT/TauT family transport system permease protein